eukprot:5870923-Lingulodinium_polyedra.AAC.1
MYSTSPRMSGSCGTYCSSMALAPESKSVPLPCNNASIAPLLHCCVNAPLRADHTAKSYGRG